MRSSDKGFTLLEVMVASMLGLVLIALSMTSVLANRKLYKTDLVRTRINQNMRSALDILGSDIREAGENLVTTFPSIEIVNGASGSPDELYVRRGLIDEILKLCTAVGPSTPLNTVYFGNSAGTIPGCDYSSQATNFNGWKNYRTTQGGMVDAYVYDSSTKKGEFFKYTGETNTGSAYFITANDAVWANPYGTTASSVYLLEEWHYRFNSGVLQLIVNNDNANPMDVVFDVSDFQVSATLTDGTVKTAFAPTDDWTKIQFIDVSVTGKDTVSKKAISRTLSARYFPRNILSH